MIIPSQSAPDSGAQALTPTGDRAWTPGRHSLAAAPDGVPEGLSAQRRCGWCGASDLEAVLVVARWDTSAGGPMARCRNIGACVERWLAAEDQRAADGLLAGAPGMPEAAAETPEEPEPGPAAGPPRKPRARPSQARKAVTAKATGDGSRDSAAAADGRAPAAAAGGAPEKGRTE